MLRRYPVAAAVLMVLGHAQAEEATAPEEGDLHTVTIEGKFIESGAQSAMKQDISVMDTPYSVANYGDASEHFDVMQIIGQDHHHRRGGHPDKKGELSDIETPGNVAAHAGDAEAGSQLNGVAETSDADQEQ